jgi:hypothetical protein
MVLRGKQALCAIALSAAACSSTGVVPGTTFDEPMEVPGVVINPLPAGARPIVSVLWSDPAQSRPDVVMPARWTSSEVTPAGNGTNQTTVLLRLFRAPPSETLTEVVAPTGEVALIAVGDLVIVDDADGDGTFYVDARGNMSLADGGGGDRYLAGTGSALVYVARTLSPTVTVRPAIALFRESGYQILNYECDGRIYVKTEKVQGVVFDVSPSTSLVERRNCLRTHSP